jgi:murein DD-endopeptidase MepM/ murein hydrolase activator NlpD
VAIAHEREGNISGVLLGSLSARLLAGALLGLLVGATATGADPRVRVTVTPATPYPGDVVLIRASDVPPQLGGEWDGHPLSFFPVPDGVAALVGIDLDRPAGPIAWRLSHARSDGDRELVAAGSVLLLARTFPTQRLVLPRGQVDLDLATLARVRGEQAELHAVLAAGTGARLWRGPFRVPVDGGRPTGGFGLRRIINDQPRSPHTGYDWAAPRGTPVLAANAGRVALVAEHFFAGRLVVLDHGLGLFTLYFHLDDTRVRPVEDVARGQRIGSVGATGRATGPHLHLGVSLGGARVDPMALLALSPPPDPW